MPTLVLMRHAMPAIDRAQPAAAWPLAPEGVAAAQRLTAHVRPYALGRFVSSPEPKALGTAQAAAAGLGLPVGVQPGLEEHHRSRVPWFPDQAQFEAHVAAFFAQPEACVFGDESAHAASARFGTAVDAALAAYPGQNLGIASGGTVLALWLARHAGLGAFATWGRWGLPGYAVVDVAGPGQRAHLLAFVPSLGVVG